ncbi:NTP transferase domain-containing protein [Harryflintia acetispora]|uniref:phosphocholine cytidylyltransferase family protein n=1 Tax=Harryflintia acetispora TaxID=1849041 RepID=UPI001896FC70|nr:phosphocholine cytidylyltransferase family protein [Harryflintia acetispora]
MKAIILAAGKGSRIAQHIGNIPKSTVKLLNGEPIIRRNVQMLTDMGIETVVCVGYKRQLIKDSLQGLTARYYNNPFYEVTNNIASLWLAREELTGDDDVLLLSGDLYFPKEFIFLADRKKADIVLLADSSRIYDGDFYFNIDSDGKICSYGPQTPLPMRSCEYMGITKISRGFIPKFAKRMYEMIDAGKINTYFEDIALSFRNNADIISVVDVAGHFWREFDYIEDYKLILKYEKEQSPPYGS